MKLARREFIGQSFLAFLASLGAGSLLSSLSGCSSAADGSVTAPTTGGDCIDDGTSISIQLVHTPNHTLSIPASDVIAGVQKTYTLADNGSGHTHDVTITAADFTKLQSNQGIQETSTVTGHTHLVTVNCA